LILIGSNLIVEGAHGEVTDGAPPAVNLSAEPPSEQV
jgi:hypothetical protein